MASNRSRRTAHPVDAPSAPAEEQPNPATQMLVNKTIRDAERRRDKRAKERAGKVYFLHCPRIGWDEAKQEGHMAAFLVDYEPGQVIKPTQWYSAVHKLGDPWTLPYIPCQECYLEGEERHWDARVRPTRRGDGGYNFVLAENRKHAVGLADREIVGARHEELDMAPDPVRDAVEQPVPVAAAMADELKGGV